LIQFEESLRKKEEEIEIQTKKIFQAKESAVSLEHQDKLVEILKKWHFMKNKM